MFTLNLYFNKKKELQFIGLTVEGVRHFTYDIRMKTGSKTSATLVLSKNTCTGCAVNESDMAEQIESGHMYMREIQVVPTEVEFNGPNQYSYLNIEHPNLIN
jgi:hypothetical protein